MRHVAHRIDDPDRAETAGGDDEDAMIWAGQLRQLRVVYGVADRSVVGLVDDAIEIGRKPGGIGVALADDEASRRHARVAWDALAASWMLEDLGSRNGTFVNGVRIGGPTALASGAVVRIGKTLLVYVDTELPTCMPLAREEPPLLGVSVSMQRLRGEIARVAPHHLSVLICGETGVGKDLVAEQIHAKSGRGGPFVAVNCAAIHADLAESELFGHVAGGFTGATQRGEGLFAAAHQGTLFLDEIGELPIGMQPKLVRALSTGEVRAVGSTETRRVDVRVVSATLRDLSADERAGRFREHLLSRLCAWTIQVPPLRERREDILGVADAILRRQPEEAELSATAAEAILLHDWPGNLRELEQVLAATAVRRNSGLSIRLEHLPPTLADRVASRVVRVRGARSALDGPIEASVPNDTAPTRDDLCRVLAYFSGNVAQVAGFFGKDRHQVYRWADRLKVSLDTYRR
jgi:DNA-binding NtrC family response regulator